MEQYSSIFGDADSNTPCTHNTTHHIAVSTQSNFCTPMKLCPQKLSIAKSSFDEMQRLGIIRPSKHPYASSLHFFYRKKTPKTGNRLETNALATKSQFAIRVHCHCFHPLLSNALNSEFCQ